MTLGIVAKARGPQRTADVVVTEGQGALVVSDRRVVASQRLTDLDRPAVRLQGVVPSAHGLEHNSDTNVAASQVALVVSDGGVSTSQLLGPRAPFGVTLANLRDGPWHAA